MFSDGSVLQSQINSMILSKRPASNASVSNSEYNMMTSVETSQKSLRQAVMATINRKTNRRDEGTIYTTTDKLAPLDSRFTKSLQIASPNSKFSHRETKIAVKSPSRKLFLRYNTTLIGHKNSVTCLAFDTKYYTNLFSGSKDYCVKVWHCTSFTPRTIVDNESSLPHSEECYKTLTNHTKYINSLCYLPNSEVLISAGADQRLCVTNVKNTEEFETVKTYRK